MILHPIIDLLKRIVVALPDYGGGGELPESITAIDGGSFTVTSNTRGDNYLIEHSLSETPKFFIIWCDGIDLETASNNLIIDCDFSVVNTAAGLTGYAQIIATYNNNLNSINITNIGSNFSEWANSNNIKINSSTLYSAGENYNWIALV